MTALVTAVVAAAVLDGGTAIALDDGTVWLVDDGAFEELGACDDGEVAVLEAGGGELAVECGDGARWRWSAAAGWQLEALPAYGDEPLAPARSWWPTVEVGVRRRDATDEPPTLEGWVWLRWNL